MKRVLFLGAALVATTPAVAQDARAPFTGPRVEARVGLDRPVFSIDGDSGGKSGVVYGGEAGFDVDIGTLVAGAYAGIEGSSVKECAEVFGLDEACLRAGRNITAGGRVGARVGERTLVYAKGGYSNGRLRATYEDFENLIPDQSAAGNVDGFHVGAGVEALLTRNLYGKLEYVYTNYDTGRYDDGDFSYDVDLERHQAVVAVGIRF